MKLVYGFFWLLVFGLSAISSAQTASSINLQPLPLSRPVLYGILFKEVANFQTVAAKLSSQNKPGTFFQHYHGQIFDLSPALEDQLKTIALPSAAKIQDFDRRAFALIKATKDKYRGAARNSTSLVPPPPAALMVLQQERNSSLNADVNSLAAAFGPAQFAVFEGRVRQYVGSHFTSATQGH